MKHYVPALLLISIFCSASNAETPTTAGCPNSQFKQSGGFLRLGQVEQVPGQCIQAKCEPGGELSYTRCVTAILSPGCTIIPEDPSKPFPECCESYDCPKPKK